jgi:hypothetical protein
VDISAHYVTREARSSCILRIDQPGLEMWFGKKYGIYTWDQIRRISFEDPGRTKASGPMLALFGLWGLASRRAFTLIIVSTQDEELLFDNDSPVGVWKASAKRIVDDVPAAGGKIYVDGEQLRLDSTPGPVAAPTPTMAGWYPDPLGQPRLRWHDGSAWTDHTSEMPAAPQ